jgi:hypothetical protein
LEIELQTTEEIELQTSEQGGVKKELKKPGRIEKLSF